MFTTLLSIQKNQVKKTIATVLHYDSQLNRPLGKFGDKVSLLKLLYYHVVKGNVLHFQG